MPATHTTKGFPARLLLARQTRRVTQRGLAKLCGHGMEHYAISKYESGVHEPGLSVLASLCKALQVTCDWLVGLSDEGGPEA